MNQRLVHTTTMASRTFSSNQISRLARLAVAKSNTSKKRVSSTEPTSQFVKYVEKNAFSEKNTKRSIVFHALGERFPYLQMLAVSCDFELLAPAQIAAIYVTARARRNDWHHICSAPDVANLAPREELVESVNAYFDAAGAPQSDELHEMHQMFVEFMEPDEREANDFAAMELPSDAPLSTVAFLAAVGGFDTSSIGASFRQHSTLMGQKSVPATQTTCAFIFRAFKPRLTWAVKK